MFCGTPYSSPLLYKYIFSYTIASFTFSQHRVYSTLFGLDFYHVYMQLELVFLRRNFNQPSIKWHVRFTMVICKTWSHQELMRYHHLLF